MADRFDFQHPISLSAESKHLWISYAPSLQKIPQIKKNLKFSGGRKVKTSGAHRTMQCWRLNLDSTMQSMYSELPLCPKIHLKIVSLLNKKLVIEKTRRMILSHTKDPELFLKSFLRHSFRGYYMAIIESPLYIVCYISVLSWCLPPNTWETAASHFIWWSFCDFFPNFPLFDYCSSLHYGVHMLMYTTIHTCLCIYVYTCTCICLCIQCLCNYGVHMYLCVTSFGWFPRLDFEK